MPRIGTFEDTGHGSMRGGITSLGMSMSDIDIVPVTPRHPRGAQFMLFKNQCEVGRAWRATTLDNREFLSVQLDGPVLPRAVWCKLFRIGQSNLHRLVWTERFDPDPRASRDPQEATVAEVAEDD